MITRESLSYKQVRDMAPTEKLQLVDLLLTDLDQPDEALDRIWAAEAKKRWAAYKAGQLKTVPYAEVMAKYQRAA